MASNVSDRADPVRIPRINLDQIATLVEIRLALVDDAVAITRQPICPHAEFRAFNEFMRDKHMVDAFVAEAHFQPFVEVLSVKLL